MSHYTTNSSHFEITILWCCYLRRYFNNYFLYFCLFNIQKLIVMYREPRKFSIIGSMYSLIFILYYETSWDHSKNSIETNTDFKKNYRKTNPFPWGPYKRNIVLFDNSIWTSPYFIHLPAPLSSLTVGIFHWRSICPQEADCISRNWELDLHYQSSRKL